MKKLKLTGLNASLDSVWQCFTPTISAVMPLMTAGQNGVYGNFPNFPKLRDAVKLRYALFPYIYTMARETFDTGIGMCRPLYYEYPESEEAYKYEGEYSLETTFQQLR